MTLHVRCEQLTAGWPGKVLIERLGLDVALDELNCALPIIGRTGRGKSTLLYALAGMAMPMAGSISWVLGGDVAPAKWSAGASSFKATQELRRHQFGFLLQDASMIPCFTIAENLRHMLRLRGITHDLEQRIKAAIENMLIEGETPEDFLGQYPVRLSGGMRQRMALAAAIAHDPIVLFADEPTASLDDASGLDVLGVVRKWLDEKRGQRAFVFVTHRIETLYQGIGARRALRLDKSPAAKVVPTWCQIGADGLLMAS